MPHLARRGFLASTFPLAALAQAQSSPTTRPLVSFSGDGAALSPAEYLKLLQQLVAASPSPVDRYLAGGATEQLEHRFAKLLGKESAIFLPTGTMANHFAIRLLAGEKRRVLVQEQSHLYRDENDCAQMLSGLNLLPLAPSRPSFTLSEVQSAVTDSAGPPYPMPIAAISIESPVRRQLGAVFPFDEMQRITTFAHSQNIPAHLDGARLFLASAYTGVPPRQYADLFDTVYISLYKYFNAPFGAILAGPAALISKLAVLRRQFGGGLTHAWESALIALYTLDTFEERFRTAVQRGNQLMAALSKPGRIRFEPVPNGSNIFAMSIPGTDLPTLRQRLFAQQIALGPGDRFQVNETLLRRPVDELASAFQKAVT